MNVVHEDRIMLRFQTVQKVHPKQHAKMETSALPDGCASHYPPEESQIHHLQILYMLLKRSGSQGGWNCARSAFANGAFYSFPLETLVWRDWLATGSQDHFPPLLGQLAMEQGAGRGQLSLARA